MRICVQADNGDEVSIKADFVAAEQGVVTLEIENALYSSRRAQDGGGTFVHPIAGCHRRDSSLYGGSGWLLRGCCYHCRLHYSAARLKTKTSDNGLGYSETYER
jgi:hypothetical protein